VRLELRHRRGNAVVDAAVGCQACIVSSGDCAAAENCANSLDCNEVVLCQQSCQTLDCKQACEIGHDAGAALYQAFLAPLAGACMTQCAYGSNWNCVGSVVVPGPLTPTTVVTLTVSTLPGAPVPNAIVKACVANDPECSSALDTATTDDHGNATLTVHGTLPVGHGFDGYFDVAPEETADAAPAILPFLDFVPYSLSEPTASMTAFALTPRDLATLTALGGVSLPDGGAVGDLVLIALDCNLDVAPGVTFAASTPDMDPTGQIRYAAATGTVSSATATDSSGIAILFGAPASLSVVATAIPTQIGRASGTAHAFARAGGYSLVQVVPN
jgi:hypothetical protein